MNELNHGNNDQILPFHKRAAGLFVSFSSHALFIVQLSIMEDSLQKHGAKKRYVES
jgi:hypothetical protein